MKSKRSGAGHDVTRPNRAQHVVAQRRATQQDNARNLPGAEKPGRRVKYLRENPFIRKLIKRYGDLPVDQLVARWKQDNA